MAGIPTVPGSEINIQTPERAVHLNEGALNARYRGQRAIAGGLEEIGGVAGGIEEDLQKARNARVAADVDLRMRTARQTFIEGLRNDPDESKWTERANETSDQVRQDIAGAHEKVPPGMREQVDQAFKSWQGSLLAETNTLANVQTVNRAWGATKQDYVEKLRDGDAAGAMHSLQLARSTKIANPGELDQLEREIPRTIATNFIENGLRANPQGTTDLLQSGAALPAHDQNGNAIVPSKVLSPREMTALVNTGRVRTAAWQKGNFEDILATKADPITGLIPEDIVKDGMKTRQIGEVTGRNFLAAQERKVLADTAHKASELAKEDGQKLSMITAKVHDPVAWGVNPDIYAHDLTAEAADIANPALRQRAISDINRQVAAVKKTGATAEGPIEKQIYKLMNDQRETNGALLPLAVDETPQVKESKGIFSDTSHIAASTKYLPVAGGLSAIKKMDDTEIQAKYGPKATKDSVIESINVHSAKIQTEMAAWFKTPEGSKATFDQANDHRKELERPYVMESVRQTLSQRPPAIVNSKEEYDILPSGASYIWNGKPLTKQ